MKVSAWHAAQATPRSAPRPPRILGAGQTKSEASKAPRLASYVSRQPVIWAGGFAVIVIAGTILGAQLKSRQQAYEKRQIHQTIDPDAPDVSSTAATPIALKPQPVPSSTEIAKQIIFLEERRNALVAQRNSLKHKLEEVERKQKLEHDMRESKKAELDSIR